MTTYINIFPVSYIMWLVDSGLEDAWLGRDTRWSLAYSPSTDRLFFFRDKDTWLARTLDTSNQRKWIEHMGSKYTHCIFPSQLPYTKSERGIVIVEDIVSAMALSKSGVDALCLFGSEFTSRHRYMIVKEGYKWCAVWMDNDNTTIKMKQGAITQQVSSMGIHTALIKSEKDPKEIIGVNGEYLVTTLNNVMRGHLAHTTSGQHIELRPIPMLHLPTHMRTEPYHF